MDSSDKGAGTGNLAVSRYYWQDGHWDPDHIITLRHLGSMGDDGVTGTGNLLT